MATAYRFLLVALGVLALTSQFHGCAGQLGEGPLSPEEQVLQNCLDITTAAGKACTVESDTMSLVYPRASSELPTSEQIVGAISKMRGAAQPSNGCCTGIKPYIDANCPCLPAYQQVVPIGGFSPEYFIGTANILALACRLDTLKCTGKEAAAAPNPAG